MLATYLEQALADPAVTALARHTGFLQRRRQLTPHRLAVALFRALGSQQVQSLADLCAAFNELHGTQVTYHPFRNQLAKPTAPRFFQALLERFLQQLVTDVLTPLPGSLLAPFQDVWIQDGSGLAVHAGLRATFPGRYPVKAPAVVELHVTQSLRTDQPCAVTLTGQRARAHDYLPPPPELAGRLLLADRGYVNTSYAQAVTEAGGSFLIRYTQRVNPQVEQCWVNGERRRDWEGRSLQEVLRRGAGCDLDLDVHWVPARTRPQPVTLRLVALWNPQARVSRGKGRSTTRAEHMLLATNLARQPYAPAVVGQLYHLRWQIELLFKEWKSYANLHAFSTRSAAIAETLIWAALGAAFLKRFLAHASQRILGTGALSTRKVAMYGRGPLRELLAEAAVGAPLAEALAQAAQFLARQCRRSNAKREQVRGRAASGLRPVDSRALTHPSFALTA